jgi:hypothetical protein
MSANFDALLKPPRARSYAVMEMMTVVSRGVTHSEDNIQEQAIRVKELIASPALRAPATQCINIPVTAITSPETPEMIPKNQ